MASVIRGSDNFDSLIHQGLGVNQTWQDVIASRASGVTYTNTTGKPIMVVISGYLSGGTFTVNGVVVGYQNDSTIKIGSYIVPNGATYSATNSIYLWAELR